MTEARFLGVIVDEKLKWTKHIQAVKTKMSEYIGIMYKIKHSIPLNVHLLIYHSFIQSHLNFCSLIWGFSCKSNIDCLLTVQKKAYMRAVMPGYVRYLYKDVTLPTHTKSAFKEYKIMTVQSIGRRKVYRCTSCAPLAQVCQNEKYRFHFSAHESAPLLPLL